MSDSPAAATPYEVLGVGATATPDELRRAYRRLARETHPDLGGTPERFRQVQLAWERIGTPEDRARYDSGAPHRGADGAGSGAAPTGSASWAPTPPRARPESKPRARAYGHPGGQERVEFLDLMREWVGRGTQIDDLYDPALVRSAPAEIRQRLAKAVAEESTARIVSELGIAYTIWSNVAAGREPELDHVVLGPTGLFATAHLMVVPDEAVPDPVQPIGRGHRNSSFVVRRSVLAHVLRGALTGGAQAAAFDVFPVRERIQQTARFV